MSKKVYDRTLPHINEIGSLQDPRNSNDDMQLQLKSSLHVGEKHIPVETKELFVRSSVIKILENEGLLLHTIEKKNSK